MKVIELTRGYVALVDDEDYEELARLYWQVRVKGKSAYAVTSSAIGGHLYMHRHIMGLPSGGVDHILHHAEELVVDNRRSNLRLASPSQNGANSGKKATTGRDPSVFKGVSKNGPKWQTQARLGNGKRYLGRFTEEAHAAYAYDLAAVAYFGEFALCNFPVPGAKRWLFGDAETIANNKEVSDAVR